MSLRKSIAPSSVYSGANRVKLIKGGKGYFDLLEKLIQEAKITIHLQTYIYSDDETGQRITRALTAAVRRGVAVYLLLDGYGSEHLTARWTRLLDGDGIHFRWFAPIFHTRHFYFGRRLHHKIFVADARVCLVGGINISNRYNDLPDQPAWLDWAIYCEGEAAAELWMVCVDVWTRSSWKRKKADTVKDVIPANKTKHNCLVRVRRNDWVRRQMQITRSYQEMFSKAQSDIIIMSSYFLPGYFFRKAMLRAVKRGVRIKVIAAGKSDVMTAKNAERYLYRWLLTNGIELYEYQPHILHGKISSYDNKWVTVGSYNVNDISTFASMELNMDVLDESFAREVNHELEKIMKDACLQITPEHLVPYENWLISTWQKTCYYFIRMVFLMFTFYFRQKRSET